MERISFQVAEYDAPLDLILHLISKHKLDIMDIDISSLLEQYMAVIDTWQEQDLDVTSEFLTMASRLVHMKTVSLLPRHEEESEKLKRDFSGELMEYRICKEAAQMLDSTNYYSELFVREPANIAIDNTYKHIHPPYALYEAFINALGSNKNKKQITQAAFDPIVAKPVVSVNSKIFSVLRLLKAHSHVTLEEIFDPELGRSGLVATFLAVLELIKSGGIYLDNNNISLKKVA